MATTEDTFGAHIRAALTAALLLALCQVVVEAVLIATRFQPYFVSPHRFSHTQMYDWCVKLFILVPWAGRWMHGGALDRFLPVGFNPKLVLAGGLAVPNLLVSVVAGCVLAGIRFALRRPARVLPVLWTLIGIGLVVHLASFGFAVRFPRTWAVRGIVAAGGRVFVYEGTWIAFVTLALAGGAAALMARLQPRMRWAVSLGTATAAAAAAIALVPASPAASAVGVVRVPPRAAQPLLPAVKNVVLISIDSLRADRLGSYGNPHDTSPTLDALAGQGVRFTDTMSSTSWTLPAHMSLLTGRYVLSHGVIGETDRLPAGVPTLAETLHGSNVATGGVVSTLFLAGRYGFSRGFDYYDDHSALAKNWYDELSSEPAPTVTKLAIDWLRERHDERFFLFVHYWDVHYDYIPPAPYDAMFDPNYKGSITGVNFYHNSAVNRHMPRRDLEHIEALYDGEIRWVDDHIARILSALDDSGLADQTAVIVTADHGDEFFEHGGKGHQRTLYREVVQVPLIMRVPGVHPGQVVKAPVSLVDVMPTVLDLMQVRPPADMNGTSLVPILAGSGAQERSAIYGWLCNPRRSTSCEAMRYSPSETLFHMFQPSRIELYGANDPAQHHNVAGSSQWPIDRLLAQLNDQLNSEWRVYRGLEGQRGSVTIDKATLERLRALGYVE
jgi:arylsulfatase A-like enzyme